MQGFSCHISVTQIEVRRRSRKRSVAIALCLPAGHSGELGSGGINTLSFKILEEENQGNSNSSKVLPWSRRWVLGAGEVFHQCSLIKLGSVNRLGLLGPFVRDDICAQCTMDRPEPG